MKKITVFLLALICVGAYAQECKNYYFLTGNSVVEMTLYDKKGEVNGKQTWTISEVKKDGSNYLSTVSTLMVDEKGKEITKSTGQYKCVNGVLQADIRMNMSSPSGQNTSQNEVTYDGNYIEYPATMQAGQSLPDAEATISMKNQGGMATVLNFKLTGRTVVDKETITSPAGTWEAFKITYDAEMKIKIAGIGIPTRMKVTEWFVPGFGMVKSETYTKNGKLMGSSMITSIKK